MLRCSRLLSWLWILAVAAPLAAADRPKPASYALQVRTDRADALYKVGEPVEFRIQVTSGNAPVPDVELEYTLSLDGYKNLSSGKVTSQTGPVSVRGDLKAPGFLRCAVTLTQPNGKKLTRLAAAAIDPTAIPASLPVPDDFDAFWAEQKQQLAKIAPTAELTAVKSPVTGVECFDVQVACQGAPVSGYFAKPAGAAPKSLPAVLYVHGAGVRSAILNTAASAAAKGRLAMDLNAHGIPNGKPDQYYKDLSSNELLPNDDLKNYRLRGRESRDEYYFRGMYLRLVRAIDFLTAQPEWDGRTVVVTGHSQGGGQSLVAAGIDPRVTFIAAGVPAMCDHSGNAAGRISGWPKLVPTDKDGVPDPKILEVARYFDAMNFATRSQADAILSVGFIDVTCPASSVYATYNNLPAGKAKEMANAPLMGHAALPWIRARFESAIDEHIRQQGRKSAFVPGAGSLRLTLPPVLHAVPGVETNVYFDNIVLTNNPGNYAFEVKCTRGLQQAERWTLTPKPEDAGSHPWKITVFNDANEVVAQGTTTLRVAHPDSGADRPVSVLLIGDSLTHASTYPQQLLDRCAAQGNPKLTLVGSHTPKADNPANRHEGYGGWTAHRFATHFAETARTGAAGKRGSPFLYRAEDGRPRLDFAKYCQEVNEGRFPEYVTIFLGPNDTFRSTSESLDQDIDTMLTYYDSLIKMVHDVSPATVVGVMLPVPPSASQDAFAGKQTTRWQYKRNQHQLMERMLGQYGGRDSERIVIIPTACNLDCEHNYPAAKSPVNAHIEEPTVRQNNAVHPAASGYRQIGDSVYSWLKVQLDGK